MIKTRDDIIKEINELLSGNWDIQPDDLTFPEPMSGVEYGWNYVVEIPTGKIPGDHTLKVIDGFNPLRATTQEAAVREMWDLDNIGRFAGYLGGNLIHGGVLKRKYMKSGVWYIEVITMIR